MFIAAHATGLVLSSHRILGKGTLCTNPPSRVPTDACAGAKEDGVHKDKRGGKRSSHSIRPFKNFQLDLCQTVLKGSTVSPELYEFLNAKGY